MADATAAELMQGGGDEIRFGGSRGLDLESLAAHLGAPVREERPGEYLVSIVPSPANVAALTTWLAERNLPLADLRAGRQSLEDVFLRLTREVPPDGAADAPASDAPASIAANAPAADVPAADVPAADAPAASPAADVPPAVAPASVAAAELAPPAGRGGRRSR